MHQLRIGDCLVQVEGCNPPAQAHSRPKGPPFKRPRDSSLFSVSGNMGQIHPLSQKMQFEGKWQQHAEHGLQLVCTKVQLLQNDPASRALAEITGQVSGVGKHTAERLVQAFGQDVTKVNVGKQSAERVTGLLYVYQLDSPGHTLLDRPCWTEAICFF